MDLVPLQVYSARRLIRDFFIGSFSMNMGVVYKSRRQAVVEKWLALMPSRAEDENGVGGASEIRGFLKMSICVFHAQQIPPALTARGGGGGDGEDEDVLYRAQLLNYCLRVGFVNVLLFDCSCPSADAQTFELDFVDLCTVNNLQ